MDPIVDGKPEGAGKSINEDVIAEHFRVILEEGLGVSLTDENFKGTPKRVAKAYKEIFSGLGHTTEDIDAIFKACFPTSYSGIVLEKDITVFSMCPHHFLPVRYDISVGYIPSDCGIGLSKLARVVELLAKRPALQESFTQEIVDLLVKHLNAKGAICKVTGAHYCMQMRGVKQKNVVTTTSAARGTFLTQPELELKFYDLLRNS